MPSVGPTPWYIQMFQWASWISYIIYPLVAIGVAVLLFLLWKEARRYVDYLTGTVRSKAKAEADEPVLNVKPVDVKNFVE